MIGMTIGLVIGREGRKPAYRAYAERPFGPRE